MFVWVLLSMAVLAAKAQQQDTLKAHLLSGVVVYGEDGRKHLSSSAPLQQIGMADHLRLGITDMADALNRLAGVTLRDHGGAGGMKTVSVRGFGAAHTGVMYDGVMLSEIQSGEIDVARYAIDNLQTIGLIIGDADDIFVAARQASTPAVLQLTSLNHLPTDGQAHLTAQMRVGSFGYASPYVRYDQRLSSRVVLTALADYVYADNDYPFKLRNGSTTTIERRTNSRMNSGHAEMASYWQTGRNGSLATKVYYYDNDRQLPGIVQHYTNVCGQQLHDRNFFAQARWMGSLGSRLTLRALGKANWASSAYRDTLIPDRRDDATYLQREYYGSLSMLYQMGRRWQSSVATDYFYNNLSSTQADDIRPHRHTLLSTAAIKYEGSALSAQARLLWTFCQNGADRGAAPSDMHRWSPSVSLAYRLPMTEVVYVRASFKDIFRAPTFNECYFRHYGSTDIRPENTRQYNLGLTWQHQSRMGFALMMTADAYHNRITDKIVAVPYNMFVWRTVNMAKVVGYGLDATLRAEMALDAKQRLDATITYTYQRLANHTNRASAHYGKQIPYQPLNSGHMALGWTNPWVGLSAHATASGGRWATSNHYAGTHMGGYCDVGISAYHRFALAAGALYLRADVENLLGKQYELVANYPMPRARWRFTLRWQM